MLADPVDLNAVTFPLLASVKLDGIRASVINGAPLTRSLKAIPNKFIQAALSGRPELEGFDGELIVGEPNVPDVYRNTVSSVMKHAGQPEFTYYVFDLHDTDSGYSSRREELAATVASLNDPRIRLLGQSRVDSMDQLLRLENDTIELGYEGLILRGLHSPYKFGRSTAKEGYLLKLKRFADSEAEVLGVVEEMFNGNEAKTNELGRTKRSTAAAGLSGKDSMGALQVRDLKTGVEFSIGSGFTAEERAAFYRKPPKIVKYKSFLIGVKDKPRHPVFLGVRDTRDM